MRKLRYYQQAAKQQIREVFSRVRAAMYVLVTGGGKTVVFSSIAADAVMKGSRVLILVHRKKLLRQTSESLRVNGVFHGLIHPDFTDTPHAPVQVASVWALVRRLKRYDMASFNLVIIDECHHANASTWSKIIAACTNAYILGVTATPVRGDGGSLGAESGGHFSEMILGPQLQEMIDQGFLVRAKVYAPKNRIDFDDVGFDKGDFDKQQVLAKVDKPSITGDAVEHYTRLCPNVPCVVSCIDVSHAEKVAQEFCTAGYVAKSVTGNMPEDERDAIFDELASGQTQIITFVDVISEGVDIPMIVCLIMLRPTASTGLYLQWIGRVLRSVYAHGYELDTPEQRQRAISESVKPHAIVLDHVGNCFRHGMPDEHRDWVLNGQKKQTRKSLDEQQEKIKIMQCPMCYNIHEPAESCPECGHVYEVKKRTIVENDGELHEVTGLTKKQIEQNRRREIASLITLDDHRAYAKLKGYDHRWAQHVWGAKQKKRAVPVLNFNSEIV